MKYATLILIVTLLSHILCDRTTLIFATLDSPTVSELVLDTQDQAEDNFAEIGMAIISKTSFSFFVNGNKALTLAISPSILQGMDTNLWNPPK